AGTAGTVALTGTDSRRGGGQPAQAASIAAASQRADSASPYSTNGAHSPHPAGPRSSTASRAVTPRNGTVSGTRTTSRPAVSSAHPGRSGGGGTAPSCPYDRRMPSPEVSELFDPDSWREVGGVDLTDVTYHRHVTADGDGPVVRVAFDRPEVRNAFRPHTVDELYRGLAHARMSPDGGCGLL